MRGWTSPATVRRRTTDNPLPSSVLNGAALVEGVALISFTGGSTATAVFSRGRKIRRSPSVLLPRFTHAALRS